MALPATCNTDQIGQAVEFLVTQRCPDEHKEKNKDHGKELCRSAKANQNKDQNQPKPQISVSDNGAKQRESRQSNAFHWR